ncbi:B3/B4 domain-containing protein [Agromyces sp. Marseille-Q5079]|uniref:B3/B4 domain-containing protein n=1 Tax=Agromyces sp. Marseille-Q5079 TaxID=3439059 RepID=UPI003D9CBD98
MPELQSPEAFLAACEVESAVFELRPDYRALLLVVDGLDPDAASSSADELIDRAEAHARALLDTSPVEDLPHIAAWRDAYRSFGAKPQRTRNSLEALTRRAAQGLPRVNALTDVYNAISVLHQVPIGGEDFHRYEGPARLVRAVGEEPFDAVANGESVIEHPEAGEVVWCDDAGVTCRRWNWRQGRRTGLSDQTRAAFFILDVLAPVTDLELTAAADALAQPLSALGSEIRISRRLVDAP